MNEKGDDDGNKCNLKVVQKVFGDSGEYAWKFCNMPSATATNVTYINPHGCGPCLNETKGVSCVQCETSKCNLLRNRPIKCFQGDGESEPTECDDTSVEVCSGPRFNADIDYACGPCPEGTKGITCKECTGRTKRGCNGPNKISIEYECLAYEFDSETGKPKQKGKTTCTTGFDDLFICNKPAYRTEYFFDDSTPIIPTNLTYTNSDTCGPCNSDSTACIDCNFALCNKQKIKCFQSIHGATKATECRNSVGKVHTTCRKTTFVDYSGYKQLHYACGKCKHVEGAGKSGKCEECEGSITEGCNVPVIQGQDYKCYNYTWDGRFTRELYTSSEILCKRLPGDPAICNMPGSKEKMDFYTLPLGYELLCNFLPISLSSENNICDIPSSFQKNRADHSMPLGCGPCDSDRNKSGTCQQCEGEFCNQLSWTGSGPEFRVQVSATLILFLSIAVAHLFK